MSILQRSVRRRFRDELAERLRDVSIAVYDAVAAHARERGVILADTKFEFGFDAHGTLTLGDEVCTPDSSRFWPADRYEVGGGQPPQPVIGQVSRSSGAPPACDRPPTDRPRRPWRRARAPSPRSE